MNKSGFAINANQPSGQKILDAVWECIYPKL